MIILLKNGKIFQKKGVKIKIGNYKAIPSFKFDYKKKKNNFYL